MDRLFSKFAKRVGEPNFRAAYGDFKDRGLPALGKSRGHDTWQGFRAAFWSALERLPSSIILGNMQLWIVLANEYRAGNYGRVTSFFERPRGKGRPRRQLERTETVVAVSEVARRMYDDGREPNLREVVKEVELQAHHAAYGALADLLPWLADLHSSGEETSLDVARAAVAVLEESLVLPEKAAWDCVMDIIQAHKRRLEPSMAVTDLVAVSANPLLTGLYDHIRNTPSLKAECEERIRYWRERYGRILCAVTHGAKRLRKAGTRPALPNVVGYLRLEAISYYRGQEWAQPPLEELHKKYMEDLAGEARAGPEYFEQLKIAARTGAPEPSEAVTRLIHRYDHIPLLTDLYGYLCARNKLKVACEEAIRRVNCGEGEGVGDDCK